MIMQKLLVEGSKTLRLALPMILGKAGTVILHIIDAVMIAQLGVVALSACAFGGNFVGFFLICGIGICSAVHVKVAHSSGSDAPLRALSVVKHGIWLSIFFGLFFSILLWFALRYLHLLGQPSAVTEASKSYILLLTSSIIPVLIYECLKSYYEATNRSWIPMPITLAGIVLNVVLNQLLIFGYMGFPQLGLAGAGLATLIARLFMTITLALYLVKSMPATVQRSLTAFFKLKAQHLKAMIAIALPASLQIFGEMSFYNVLVLIAGWLGTESLVAHHIAMIYVQFILMIPYVFSQATSIRVGKAFADHNAYHIRLIYLSSVVTCSGCLAFFAPFAYFGRAFIFGIFVEPGAAFDALEGIFVLVLMFSIIHSIYINTNGSLRGVLDVKFPSYMLWGVLWCIAMPLVWLLAFELQMGLVGFWWAINVGISLNASILTLRFAVIRK